jgi:hypothetical protein
MAVLFLSGVQHYAETPEGMATVPDYVREMMSKIPVTWDETRFIDGYPGRYIVISRRSGDVWYLAGVNAQKESLRLTLPLPFRFSTPGTIITEGETPRSFSKAAVTPDPSGNVTVDMQPSGGFVIKFEKPGE